MIISETVRKIDKKQRGFEGAKEYTQPLAFISPVCRKDEDVSNVENRPDTEKKFHKIIIAFRFMNVKQSHR